MYVTVAALVVLTSCGDEDSGQGGPDSPARKADGLVATLPDNSRVTLNPTAVQCVPSEEDPDVEVLEIFADLPGARLHIQAVPTDEARSFDLPIDAGDYESGAENISVFIGAPPDVEASSAEEESSGTLELLRASCAPETLEFKIDATLGSETADDGAVRVQGHLVAAGEQ
ncbi:hypothetical protein ASE01_23715 [Nocardioides sp. Root190]|nr:hypothetical protein ASE01_23715 [Nocardioides sp. Root190]